MLWRMSADHAFGLPFDDDDGGPIVFRDPPSPVPDPPDENTRYLSLSDRVDCHAMLDPIDHEWALSVGRKPYVGLWYHTYGSGSMNPETGVIDRPDGIYARKVIAGELVFLHRAVLIRACGPPPISNWLADHKNGFTLDCRRKNLQWASRSDNAKNIAGTDLRERLTQEVGT